MTDAPTNVINMQAKAGLIREAREAREKRHRERGLFASMTTDQQRQALDYRGEETLGAPFPGGADVRLMTASEREAMERATAEVDAEVMETLRQRGTIPHTKRLAKYMAKVRAGEIEGVTIEAAQFTPKDRQGDPDFPGIPELAHFYKPPGTCEICGSVSPPNTKVCLACAVASEVDNMGV